MSEQVEKVETELTEKVNFSKFDRNLNIEEIKETLIQRMNTHEIGVAGLNIAISRLREIGMQIKTIKDNLITLNTGITIQIRTSQIEKNGFSVKPNESSDFMLLVSTDTRTCKLYQTDELMLRVNQIHAEWQVTHNKTDYRRISFNQLTDIEIPITKLK